MEIVASIHLGKPPVEPSLVFVVSGAKFGEGAVSIGSDNGVKVGSCCRSRDLGDDRSFQTCAEDGYRVVLLVFYDAQFFREQHFGGS